MARCGVGRPNRPAPGRPLSLFAHDVKQAADARGVHFSARGPVPRKCPVPFVPIQVSSQTLIRPASATPRSGLLRPSLVSQSRSFTLAPYSARAPDFGELRRVGGGQNLDPLPQVPVRLPSHVQIFLNRDLEPKRHDSTFKCLVSIVRWWFKSLRNKVAELATLSLSLLSAGLHS